MYASDFEWAVLEWRSEAASMGCNWESDFFLPSVVRGFQRHTSQSSTDLQEQANGLASR